MVAQEQERESESIRQLRRRNHPAVLTPVPVPVTIQALNRLEWPMQYRTVIAGVRVLFRSSGEQGWDRLQEYLPKGRPFNSEHEPEVIYSITPAGAPHLLEPVNQHVVYGGPARVIRDRSLDVVLKKMAGDLTSVLAHRSRRFSFFHAGAVGLRDAGVVLPGPSESGKSTLVQALLEIGATYYSDEVAAVDPAGKVHAYLKPLWLRPDRDFSKEKTLIPAAALGAKIGRRILPVRLVAFPEWRPRSRFRVTRLPRSTASLALFSNGFASRAYPFRTLSDATAMVEDAVCVHVRYPEAERAVPVLQELLDEALST